MIQKPDAIYTTEETTTKKFNYAKPDGWDKKKLPKVNAKKFKMKWWMIIRDVWSGNKDIEPKYLMKYDDWLHELKLVIITLFIGFCLIFIVFNSPLLTSSAINETDNEKETWFDKGMDYVFNKYDDMKSVSIIKNPDSIHHIEKDTILTNKQIDSIINLYNENLH